MTTLCIPLSEWTGRARPDRPDRTPERTTARPARLLRPATQGPRTSRCRARLHLAVVPADLRRRAGFASWTRSVAEMGGWVTGRPGSGEVYTSPLNPGPTWRSRGTHSGLPRGSPPRIRTAAAVRSAGSITLVGRTRPGNGLASHLQELAAQRRVGDGSAHDRPEVGSGEERKGLVAASGDHRALSLLGRLVEQSRPGLAKTDPLG
jgi:hypothetical protein